jgi:ornithine cyclodeaminase
MAALPRLVRGFTMLIITEEQSAELISHEIAFEAVRKSLVAAVHPDTVSFPVVIGHGSDSANRFTVKSGSAPGVAGLKVGSYWPGNADKGQPRHNSTILLIEQSSGRIGAVIEAGKVNAYRTAAANAVATKVLARADSKTLALIGTGHQARYEVEAIARILPIDKVLVVGRSQGSANAMADFLISKGMNAEVASPEAACREADIVVTATTAHAPLFDAAWIRPGTHISSMGSDAIGKQELPPELFARARLFCDLPEQSRRIGEFQHASPDAAITAIGSVLDGSAQGRASGHDITIFDSSGLAIQDLYIALELKARHEVNLALGFTHIHPSDDHHEH